MARVRTRFPNVFVGHPFANRFPVAKFREILLDLPFKVVYANTDFSTKHLLTIMKSNISKADYSLFDLSDWNPNVSLELGLAEGLKKVPSRRYYILLNTRRSHDVPSDIRGIQRLEYTSYNYDKDKGLGDQLIRHILGKEYWVKRIWSKIPETGRGPQKRIMCMHVLAHLRDYDKLTPENIRAIATGSRLREPDRTEVIAILEQLGLIRKLKGSSTFVRGKKLYAD